MNPAFNQPNGSFGFDFPADFPNFDENPAPENRNDFFGSFNDISVNSELPEQVPIKDQISRQKFMDRKHADLSGGGVFGFGDDSNSIRNATVSNGGNWFSSGLDSGFKGGFEEFPISLNVNQEDKKALEFPSFEEIDKSKDGFEEFPISLNVNQEEKKSLEFPSFEEIDKSKDGFEEFPISLNDNQEDKKTIEFPSFEDNQIPEEPFFGFSVSFPDIFPSNNNTPESNDSSFIGHPVDPPIDITFTNFITILNKECFTVQPYTFQFS